jgi:UDP-glucose 4-epimerase
MVKKILITGGSGYIGSHLTDLLIKDNYEVHTLDLVHPQIAPHTFYHCDINKPFELNEEFDAVVHLAALVNVGESQERPISYYITNLNGTMNVLNKIKTKNFVFASTGAAQECMSAYGVSKRAAEDVVRSYTKMANSDYTIFRFYNVIGSTVVRPTNPDGLFYNLIKAKDTGSFTIYGTDYSNTVDGTCVRDYVHVEEICHALREAIEKPANKTECLGHGVGYTVNDMVNIFQRVNDCDFDINKGPRRDGDIEYYVLEDVSPYMKNLYSIEDLLRVNA